MTTAKPLASLQRYGGALRERLRYPRATPSPGTRPTGMTRMPLKTRRWDPADHLDSDEAVLAYIDAAMEDGDPALIAAALGDVARARGMSQVARDAGLSRESLYKA